jgi:hypothetical protein
MQDTCGVTNPSGVHRHLDDLVFDFRRLPWIAIVQQEGATSTALLSAPVPLLTLTGLAMANNISTLAVGTVQDLENHDATRSRWGCSAAETFIKNSTSTPVRHLPRLYPLLGTEPDKEGTAEAQNLEEATATRPGGTQSLASPGA